MKKVPTDAASIHYLQAIVFSLSIFYLVLSQTLQGPLYTFLFRNTYWASNKCQAPFWFSVVLIWQGEADFDTEAYKSSGPHTVVPLPAASASPGDLLEVNLCAPPKPTKSGTLRGGLAICSVVSTPDILLMINFENYCYNVSLEQLENCSMYHDPKGTC